MSHKHFRYEIEIQDTRESLHKYCRVPHVSLLRHGSLPPRSPLRPSAFKAFAFSTIVPRFPQNRAWGPVYTRRESESSATLSGTSLHWLQSHRHNTEPFPLKKEGRASLTTESASPPPKLDRHPERSDCGFCNRAAEEEEPVLSEAEGIPWVPQPSLPLVPFLPGIPRQKGSSCIGGCGCIGILRLRPAKSRGPPLRMTE
jgi:hypothetical protein